MAPEDPLSSVLSDHAALISGSPSPSSKSRVLLRRAAHRLAECRIEATEIDLSGLPADALLGRRQDPSVEVSFECIARSRIVVAGSPVYRATYSGLLKVWFDLLPPNGLAGKIAVPILTGGSPAHQLALDHGFRPLFASLGATVVSSGVYAWDSQFHPDPDPALLLRVDRAVDEAVALLAVHSVEPASV